jgi:hypothetical protein
VQWIKDNDLTIPSGNKQHSNLLDIDNEALREWYKVIGELFNLFSTLVLSSELVISIITAIFS